MDLDEKIMMGVLVFLIVGLILTLTFVFVNIFLEEIETNKACKEAGYDVKHNGQCCNKYGCTDFYTNFPIFPFGDMEVVIVEDEGC